MKAGMLALLISLFTTSSYATLGDNGNSPENINEARSTTDYTSDEIGVSQSSTISSDCVNVKEQGKLCGDKAMKYCHDHKQEPQCQSLVGAPSEDSSEHHGHHMD